MAIKSKLIIISNIVVECFYNYSLILQIKDIYLMEEE